MQTVPAHSLLQSPSGKLSVTRTPSWLRRLQFFAIISIAFAACVPITRAATTYSFQEGVNGYKGTLDTQLRGATPDRDDGNRTSLSADGSDGGRPNHVLIRFENISGNGPNQIPSGLGVLYATLTLRIIDQGSDQNLHRMLKPWDESTTWNKFDPSDDGVTGDGVEAAVEADTSFTAPGGTPYSKEIILKKSTIEDWLNGKAPNYGWVFMPTGNNGVDFSSSENGTAAFRPLLTVVAGADGEPFAKTHGSTPDGFSIQLEDGTFASAKANPINPASLSVSLDGTKVAPDVKKDGTTTTVSYRSTSIFASASTHNFSVTFADTGTPAKTQTVERSFTVGSYVTLTAANKVAPDTSKRGFIWRVHQSADAGTGNSTSRAERQLAGSINGPDGTPILNSADPSAVGAADGPAQAPNPATAPIEFLVSQLINFSQTDATTTGNFRPDLQMPGIPGLEGGMDSIAAEIITFIELPAGLTTMGVNSDDGFKTSVGAVGELTDALIPPQAAGEFSGGRGASDTIFTIVATEAGVYPFRTVWEEGGGDANIEWFTVKADGTKVLLNDDANGGFKTYRAIQAGAKKAVARKVVPAPNSGGAAYDQTVTVELVDGSVPIDRASIGLKFDGAAVAATSSKAGNVTTVSFKPASLLAPKSTHTVSLTYTDAGSPVTRDWKFVTLNTDLLAYWNFNDASEPKKAKDKVGGYTGDFEGLAGYSADGKGRSGKAGDRAANFGGIDSGDGQLLKVSDASAAFLNAGGIQDQLAFSLWQRLDETRNSSAFWARSPGQDRGFQAHVPWGDQTIYFDTSGCCDGTQRISKNISELAGADPSTFFQQWHHFVFQKNGPAKQIWIDGKLFHEGQNDAPLITDFNLLVVGGIYDNTAATHGDIDDFAVFASALTPAEIDQLAKGSAPDQVRPIQVVTASAKFGAVRREGTNLVLEWTGGGTLQSSDSVTGPWADVTGAASPRTIAISGSGKFYRVKQ